MDTPVPFPEGELTELERRLSAWTPSVAALGRDRLLFEAGRASARSEARAWLSTATAAGLAALAIGLGGWAVREHARRTALELALAERSRALEVANARRRPPAPPPIPVDTPAPESYLVLSRRLATEGLDEPEPPSSPPSRERGPATPDRSLTPLSVRRPGGLMDL
jgi:hypothetical protein